MTLEADRVEHRYGASRSDLRGWALRGASATFRRGAVCAVLGRNGAGKSTLLRCLVGALRPTGGAVRFDGRSLGELGARRRTASISYVAQRPLFAAALTVREVVGLSRYAREARTIDDVAASRRAVASAIAAFELGEIADRMVTALSVGQQSRVAMARAFAQVDGDGAIVLDEPLAALDPGHARDAIALLRGFARQGGTVVASVHDLHAVWALADDAVLLDVGRVAAAGPAREILTPSTLESIFGVPFVSGDGMPVADLGSGLGSGLHSGRGSDLRTIGPL